MPSSLPTATALQTPILEALEALGGSGTNAQIEAQVAERLGLDSAQLAIPHDASRGKRTEFAYRMAWARTRLKKAGRIENVGRKTWSLAEHDASDPR